MLVPARKNLQACSPKRKEKHMNFKCSSFTWSTNDNKHLLGRTYDQFGNLEGNRIAIIPRSFQLKTEISRESTSYVTCRYAFTGMAVTGLETPVMVDGINEKGLMGALLHYPGYAVYDTQSGNGSLNIHPGFLTACLLGQCASVEQVVNLLPSINLTSEKIMGQDMPVHYIFSDTTGEALIIEPDAGGIRIYRNTIGVMTNSPDYNWHTTNLRNYTAVTNLHKPPQVILNKELSDFGEGVGGGFGLPGGYSSPSRFVRMAFLKHFAVKGCNEIEGITKMFHNFASVDIPEGILKAHADYETYEQTLCTSAMCAESLTYYFATASNRRISAVRLEKEKERKEAVYLSLPEKQDILYLT